jgi:hypothetical protein
MAGRRRVTFALAPIAIVATAAVALLASCGSGNPGQSHASHTPTPVGVGPGPSSPVVPPTPGQAAPRLTDILADMHTHAFNPAAPPTKTSTLQGGLFINWRGGWNGDPATAGANTNVQTSGQSDDTTGSSPRHDPVTDLMYLRNLRAFQVDHPGDHTFDADASRMDPIVRAEFGNYTYYRSWIYFQLRDLDRFQPGTGWDQVARHFVQAVFGGFYDGSAGAVRDRSHDYYRTDFAAESAAAFADAGARYGEPQLTDAARSTVASLLRHAADPGTHLFPLQVGNDGTVRQAQIKVGEQAQTLDALLTVYDRLRQPEILTAVRQAVDDLYSPQLGLLDTTGGGFFFSVNADGSALRTDYKESRQAWMLGLLRHLDLDAGGQAERLAPMFAVVTDRLWQSALHGYVYRTTPGFGVFVNHSGPGHAAVTEDFVTSEAMGIVGNVLAP